MLRSESIAHPHRSGVCASAARPQRRPAVWLAVLAVLMQVLLPVQAVLAAAGTNTAWDSLCLADGSGRAAPGTPAGDTDAPGPQACPVCTAVAAAVGAPPPLPAAPAEPQRVVRAILPQHAAAAPPVAAPCRLPPSRAPPARA